MPLHSLPAHKMLNPLSLGFCIRNQLVGNAAPMGPILSCGTDFGNQTVGRRLAFSAHLHSAPNRNGSSHQRPTDPLEGRHWSSKLAIEEFHQSTQLQPC